MVLGIGTRFEVTADGKLFTSCTPSVAPDSGFGGQDLGSLADSFYCVTSAISGVPTYNVFVVAILVFGPHLAVLRAYS